MLCSLDTGYGYGQAWRKEYSRMSFSVFGRRERALPFGTGCTRCLSRRSMLDYYLDLTLSASAGMLRWLLLSYAKVCGPFLSIEPCLNSFRPKSPLSSHFEAGRLAIWVHDALLCIHGGTSDYFVTQLETGLYA